MSAVVGIVRHILSIVLITLILINERDLSSATLMRMPMKNMEGNNCQVRLPDLISSVELKIVSRFRELYGKHGVEIFDDQLDTLDDSNSPPTYTTSCVFKAKHAKLKLTNK